MIYKCILSKISYLQAPLDTTPTSTSLRVKDREPPEEVVPQPVTVAVTPA